MRIPILKQGDVLVASVQSALSDRDLELLQEELAQKVEGLRIRGVIIDVTALDVIDSFATRTLRGIAKASQLRGARTAIAGIQPDVAFAMVQLGLELEGVPTVLDLDEALAFLAVPASGG